MRRILLLLCFLAIGASRQANAQDKFVRPQLGRGADTNSWEAYYQYGLDNLRASPGRAQAAFYWASRLDPRRAEPLYGQWVAFWLGDVGRWERYLQDDRRVTESREVIAADSLRLLALSRNPFVHQGLEILLYDALPGRWRQDALTRAWIAYAAADFPRATRLFGQGIGRGSGLHARARYLRAQAFAATQSYDSALVELRALSEGLDSEDGRELVRYYESKEMLHYAIGALHASRGREQEAREALARSLLENLGFYPSRVLLGMMSLDGSDPTAAVEQFREALEANPHDPVLHYWHGVALAQAGRGEEAAGSFRRAIRAQPDFAEPHFLLARTLDAAGDRAGARDAYAEYVRLAPRTASHKVRAALSRQEALSRE
jgi:tetratricopeptide (TPR) repeat protein